MPNPKINLSASIDALLAEADAKARVEQQKKSNVKAGEVKPKIREVLPTKKIKNHVDVQPAVNPSTKKNAQFFQTPDSASKIVDAVKHGISSVKANDGTPHVKVAHTKPNQTQIAKKVTVDKVESPKSKNFFTPAKSANAIERASDAKMAPAPSTKDGKLKPTYAVAKQGGAVKVKGDSKGGPIPFKDNIKKPVNHKPNTVKYSKETNSSLNIVESNIVVKLNGRQKAAFDIVSGKVLEEMIKNYKEFGYDLVIEQEHKKAVWSENQVFMSLIKNAIDAKYNEVPTFYESTVREAYAMLQTIVAKDFNDLYESKDAFNNTLKMTLKNILENASKSYLKVLETYHCKARVTHLNKVGDIELVAEARNKDMALRIVRNKIFEQIGFNVDIKHIFIDAEKFTPNQIESWSPKF